MKTVRGEAAIKSVVPAYRIFGVLVIVTAISIAACAMPPAPTLPPASQSILVSSSPAATSSVVGPVAELVLNFSPPARLHEVIVSGPDGLMPMMITPVGELSRYTLPVSELGPGNYRVTWKAVSEARHHQGSFSFVVR